MDEEKMVECYKGRPITELSKDELIEALKEAWHILNDTYPYRAGSNPAYRPAARHEHK